MLTVSTSGSAGIARSLSHLVAGPYGVPFWLGAVVIGIVVPLALQFAGVIRKTAPARSEEHTSELQPQSKLVCRLLLEKKKRAMLPRFGLQTIVDHLPRGSILRESEEHMGCPAKVPLASLPQSAHSCVERIARPRHYLY